MSLHDEIAGALARGPEWRIAIRCGAAGGGNSASDHIRQLLPDERVADLTGRPSDRPTLDPHARIALVTWTLPSGWTSATTLILDATRGPHAGELFDAALAQHPAVTGPVLAGIRATHFPSTRSVGDAARDVAAGRLTPANARTWRSRSATAFARDAAAAGGAALFDLARVLMLLRPNRMAPSDEWAALATALAGRPYSVNDLVIALATFPVVFGPHLGPVGDPDGEPEIELRSRVVHTALQGSVPPSESEHLALFRALRRRALESLASRDSSDLWVARQLPRQAMESFAFADLFKDPLAVLCSDVYALVREIEGSEDLVLNPGAKAVLLAAHRLDGRTGRARPSHLELAARRVGLDEFADTIAQALPVRPWRSTWTRSKPVNANRILVAREGAALAVAVERSSRGTNVAVAFSDGQVWTTDAYSPPRRLDEDQVIVGEARAVALVDHEDAQLVAVGTSSQQLLAFDRSTGAVRWERAALHGGPLSAVTATRCDDVPIIVSSGVDGIVHLTDARSGLGMLTSIDAHAGSEIRGLRCFEHRGRPIIAACGVGGSVHLHDLRTGELVAEHALGSGVLNELDVAQLDDGTVMVAVGTTGIGTSHTGGRALALIWTGGDLSAPPRQVVVSEHDAAVNGVSLVAQPDPVLLACAADHTWSMAPVAVGPEAAAPAPIYVEGHFGPVHGITWFQRDRRNFVVTVGGEGACRIWVPDAVVGETLDLERPTRHAGPVTSIRLLEDQDETVLIVTGGADGEVRVWDPTSTSSGPPVGRLQGEVRVLADWPSTDEDLNVIVGSLDGTMRDIRLHNGIATSSRLLGMAHMGVTALRTTSLGDRQLLVSGGLDGTIAVWDREKPNPTHTQLACRFGPVQCLAIVAGMEGDELVAVGGQDGKVSLYRLPHLEPAGQIDLGSGVLSIAGLPFQESGIVTGLVDGRVALTRNLLDGQGGWSHFPAHPASVNGIAALVIGGRLVAASAGTDRTLRIWDLSTTIQLQSIDLDGIPYQVSACSPHVGVATSAGAAVFQLNSDPLQLAVGRR